MSGNPSMPVEMALSLADDMEGDSANYVLVNALHSLAAHIRKGIPAGVIPVGEPYFVFRARDILSTMVLQRYAELLESYSPHTEKMESLVDMINEFRTWQRENPNQVRLSD